MKVSTLAFCMVPLIRPTLISKAANGSDRSYHQMKVVSAEYEQKAYQNKGDSQPPAKSFHGEALTSE